MSRALAALAIAQAVAIVVLLALWLRGSPAAVPSVEPPAPANGPIAAPSAASTGPVEAAGLGGPAREERAVTETAATGAILFGSVTLAIEAENPRGPGARLRLRRDGAEVDMTSLSGKEPAFAFAGLLPGTYELRGEAPEHVPFVREVAVAAPRTRCDVALQKAWLVTVEALDADGNALAENPAMKTLFSGSFGGALTAIATRSQLAGDLPLTENRDVEGGLGEFRGARDFMARERKPQPPRVVGVLALPPGERAHVSLLLRSVVLASSAVEPGTDVVTFQLTPDAVLAKTASIRLRVVDGNGKPVTDARIGFSDAQTSGGGSPVGEDGRIEVANLRPGVLDLDCTATNLRAPPVQVAARPGARVDLGDVVLQPHAAVTLTVEGAGERCFATLHWLETMQHADCEPNPILMQVRDGENETRLYPGRWRAKAASKDGFAVAEFDTRALAGPIRLALRPGPKLRLVNRTGQAPVVVALRDAAGIAVHRRTWHGAWEQNLFLPAGEYTATLRDLSGNETRKTVTLGASGATLVVP